MSKPQQGMNSGARNLVPTRAGTSTTLLFEHYDRVLQVLLYLHVDHVRDQDTPLPQIIEKPRCVGAVVPRHDRAVSLTEKRGIECGN